MKRPSLNQQVPTHLAFLVMIVLSFILSLYTVTTAQKIAKDASASGSFNVKVRLQKENTAENN